MRRSISELKSRRRQRLCVDVLEDRQLLSTITVNTTADETTADSTMSLRQAIEVSNGTLPVSSLSYATASSGQRCRREYEHDRLEYPHDRSGI